MEKERIYEDIILHVPHSSTQFPEFSGYGFSDLDCDERLLIDYYTDELFMPEQQRDHVESMVFPYCRLFCDVERLVRDPLEEEGLGISYSRKHSFSTLSESFRLYADFHALVSKKIVDSSGSTLLIDCHSFSNLPNLLNSNPPDIDICIGYNDDETRPRKNVIENMVRFFESFGYKVGINEPFSNSKTFPVPVEYHSVMIEVNKRLYMNEKKLQRTLGFIKLKHQLQALYDILLE
ncbi:MAG: N-formylglutamate amidohydrolase [Bacteroidaceae bacterium]|nr:N-formylglutamate amidohydrolase [Bacteroidaceae bacterium]